MRCRQLDYIDGNDNRCTSSDDRQEIVHGMARNTSAVGHARVLGTGRGGQENWCGKKQFFLVDEVLPQVTEMTRPMIEPVSWTTDEDLGQSVEVHCEGAARVPTAKFEAGQLMQWPDIKSDGVMIREIMLEWEMSPIGYVWHAAEPVSVAAKSEM